MPLTPVAALKAGMTIGNERRALYTVLADAERGPGGTAVAKVAHYADPEHPEYAQKVRVEQRTWLHGSDAQVHVRG